MTGDGDMVAGVTSDEAWSRPADRWRRMVADRAVPESIRDQAPEREWSLEPERFQWRPDDERERGDRPSRRRALEALPDGGSVLDIGVGGGASSLGLATKAGLITGVDRLPAMLASFEESGRAAGVATRAVLGAWPDVAGEVESADVVVSHHAIYGMTELESFLTAMTEHARRRVVLEVSERFPQSRLLPLWKAFHGVERPDHRVADEVEAVLVAMGLPVEREDAVVAGRRPGLTPDAVAFARRRLYVGPERDAEIEEFLRALGPDEHRAAAMWWPGTAS
jgi:SAM-dependent methyltransferase